MTRKMGQYLQPSSCLLTFHPLSPFPSLPSFPPHDVFLTLFTTFSATSSFLFPIVFLSSLYLRYALGMSHVNHTIPDPPFPLTAPSHPSPTFAITSLLPPPSEPNSSLSLTVSPSPLASPTADTQPSPTAPARQTVFQSIPVPATVVVSPTTSSPKADDVNEGGEVHTETTILPPATIIVALPPTDASYPSPTAIDGDALLLHREAVLVVVAAIASVTTAAIFIAGLLIFRRRRHRPWMATSPS